MVNYLGKRGVGLHQKAWCLVRWKKQRLRLCTTVRSLYDIQRKSTRTIRYNRKTTLLSGVSAATTATKLSHTEGQEILAYPLGMGGSTHGVRGLYFDMYLLWWIISLDFLTHEGYYPEFHIFVLRVVKPKSRYICALLAWHPKAEVLCELQMDHGWERTNLGKYRVQLWKRDILTGRRWINLV